MPSKTFILRAYATFQADDLDDALIKLAEHFLATQQIYVFLQGYGQNNLKPYQLDFIGEIEIKPEGK